MRTKPDPFALASSPQASVVRNETALCRTLASVNGIPAVTTYHSR